jgi:hypothetical protein
VFHAVQLTGLAARAPWAMVGSDVRCRVWRTAKTEGRL